MRKRITILILLMAVVVVGSLSSPFLVHAQSSCDSLTSADRIAECREQEDARNDQSSVDRTGEVGVDGEGEDIEKLNEWLNTVINVISAFIGIAIVISILVGSIQYITAGGNAAQVGAAKQRITMAVLGFALFLMGYAIIQWLVPGGLW